MGKRSKNKGKNLNGNPVDGQITTAYIRYLGTYTTVITGSTQLGSTLHPLNMGARAVELCDLFEEFRWLEVKASFLAGWGTVSGAPVMTALGITSSENLTAAPTTALQVVQFDTAHITFLNQTMPVQLKCPQSVLRGQQAWYSANDATDEPAVFFISSISTSTGLAVAGTVQVLWEARVQFKGNSDPSVSVSRRKAREMALVRKVPDLNDFAIVEEERSDDGVARRSRSAAARLATREWVKALPSC
jgi:hypothetical protein